MTDVRLLTGGEAVAHAMRQVDPDVVPVYPITPQTPIIQTFAKLVADGKASTEIVNVESEHSAMSAAIGAALAGGRTMTATSSQGLALMAEVVYIAASMRAPIVMALGNRALSGPINIHCDHSDSMLDSGLRRRPALRRERPGGLRPHGDGAADRRGSVAFCCRCSSASTASRSRTPPSRSRSFRTARSLASSVPYRVPNTVLDTTSPTTQGPFAMPDYYFELRRQQAAALETAVDVLEEVALDFERLSGRTERRARGVPTGRMRRTHSSRSAPPPGRSRTSSTSCATSTRRPGC